MLDVSAEAEKKILIFLSDKSKQQMVEVCSTDTGIRY